MDRLTTPTAFEAEIEIAMHEYGVDRGEAAVIVGMRHGDLVNDIDVVGPHAADYYRRRRRTLREVMAELGELDDDENRSSDDDLRRE